MKRKLITPITLFCSALIWLAVTSGLNGKWTGALKSPSGEEFPINYTFKVNGDTFTGTGVSPDGDIPISDGKLNGTDFSFKVLYNNTTIENSGKYYAAGDSVGLNVNFNGEIMHATLTRPK